MGTAPERKAVKVSRAQVAAAKGKIVTDRRQGKVTPAWGVKVANAQRARRPTNGD